MLIDGILAQALDGYMRLEHLDLDFFLVDAEAEPLGWDITIPKLKSFTIHFYRNQGMTVRAAHPPNRMKLIGVNAPFLANGVQADTIYLDDVTIDGNEEDDILAINGSLRAKRIDLVNIRFGELTVAADCVNLSDVHGGDLFIDTPDCWVLQGEYAVTRLQMAPALLERERAGQVPQANIELRRFRFLELPESDDDDVAPQPAPMFAAAAGAAGNLIVMPPGPINIRSPGKALYVQGRVPSISHDSELTEVFVEIETIPTEAVAQARVLLGLIDILNNWPLTLIVPVTAMSNLGAFDEHCEARLNMFIEDLQEAAHAVFRLEVIVL